MGEFDTMMLNLISDNITPTTFVPTCSGHAMSKCSITDLKALK